MGNEHLSAGFSRPLSNQYNGSCHWERPAVLKGAGGLALSGWPLALDHALKRLHSGFSHRPLSTLLAADFASWKESASIWNNGI